MEVQVPLVLEVLIDGALGDPGPSHDAGHRRRLVVVGGELLDADMCDEVLPGFAERVGSAQRAVSGVQLVVRKVEASRNVSAAQAGPRLRLRACEAPARAGVEYLFPVRVEIGLDLRDVAHELGPESRAKRSRRRSGGAAAQRPALGTPLRQPAVEHGDGLVTEDAERPPHAAGGDAVPAPVDHHPVAVADPERADRPGERVRRGQHVGQRAPRVLDLVDVEEDGPGDVGLQVLGPGVAPDDGQIPGGVEDAQIGLAKVRREPLGADHGPEHHRSGTGLRPSPSRASSQAR